MTRYNSFERFTISSKPVTADYVHAGIFVPVFSTAEDNEQFIFSPLSNAATKLAYWDEEAYVSELAVSSGSPRLSSTTSDSQVPSASDLAAAAAAGEGLIEPGKEPEAKAKKRKTDASAAGKQKKVRHWSLLHEVLRVLIKGDRAGTSSILEQSTRRAPWSQARQHLREGR